MGFSQSLLRVPVAGSSLTGCQISPVSSWLEANPTTTLNAAYLFFYHSTNSMWEQHLAAIG
jgi:hypothetical protein